MPLPPWHPTNSVKAGRVLLRRWLVGWLLGVERGGGSVGVGLRRNKPTTRRSRSVQVSEVDRVARYLRLRQRQCQRRQPARSVTFLAASLLSSERKQLMLRACHLAHLSVGLSVCLSVRKVYCGKTADWIRMPSEVVCGVGGDMGVLDGVGDRRMESGSFGGEFWASH